MLIKEPKNYLKSIKEKLSIDIRRVFITIVGFILLFILIILPSSFASVQPIKSIEIYSEKLNYQNKEAGAWKVTESAKWINKNEAEITIDVDSIKKVSEKYTDLLLVLDTSDSMDEYHLNHIKSTINEIVDKILNDTNNRIGLISFNTSSEIVSNLTNSKEQIKAKIDSLNTNGATNYYAALKNVEKILSNYKNESNRNFTVVFFTDGYPNIDTPNEVGEYSYLKKQYPFITINAIQYRLGTTIINELKNISDNQYENNSSIINKAIFEEATIPSVLYDDFKIETIINKEYFNIIDQSKIKTTKGNITYDENTQKIEWFLDKYKTSSKASMTINIKLNKDESPNVYAVLNTTNVESKIGENRDSVVSTKTPIITSKYKVTYDGNFPSECSINGTPADISYSVFDTVAVSDKKLICNGYQFREWDIVTNDVKVINNDYFIMPESDVQIRGTWSKLKVNKSTNGTIKEKFTLYDQVELDTYDSKKYARKYTNTTFNYNGTKNIYYYYGTAANNNVIFANYCWKIVRTTETGGVKLLYNGIPTSNKCNNTGYSSQLTAAQMGASSNMIAFNSNYTSLGDAGYMYNARYETGVVPLSYYKNVIFGNSFTYSNGTYTLTNTKYVTNLESEFQANKSLLDNYHYTCANTTGVCARPVYIYLIQSDRGVYYVFVENGKSIKDIINETIYADYVNSYSSTIKQVIDYWYSRNMIGFTNYLEDTVWCNERTISNLGGWNPNGGSMNYYLTFQSSSICENRRDRFTVNSSKGNGKLTYPVGLITMEEQNLSNSSNNSPLASGIWYWTMTPTGFAHTYAGVAPTVESGVAGGIAGVLDLYGVRPAISLHSDVAYSYGDGSINSPYVVSLD